MNNQNLMMNRNATGLVDPNAEIQKLEEERRFEEARFMNSFDNMSNNSGLLLSRNNLNNSNNINAANEKIIAVDMKQEEPDAPEKAFPDAENVMTGNQNVINNNNQNTVNTQNKNVASKTKDTLMKTVQATHNAAQQQVAIEKQQAAQKNVVQNNSIKTVAKPAASNNTSSANTVNTSAASVAPVAQQSQIKIKSSLKPDELVKGYIELFKKHFDLELSSSICYENMRKICEINTKEADKTLYFMENTYRLSTLLYLSGNLPIVIIATILAEKNRKNVLNYVTKEVENAAKPYDEVRDLRVKRYMRKYEEMNVNDAITVTPGVTILSSELSAAIQAQFDDISTKMKKYNAQLKKSLDKLDDEARNDVIYIYSNCWYFLQGFENVPEMRKYIMSITDDTRKNLKV